MKLSKMIEKEVKKGMFSRVYACDDDCNFAVVENGTYPIYSKGEILLVNSLSIVRSFGCDGLEKALKAYNALIV